MEVTLTQSGFVSLAVLMAYFPKDMVITGMFARPGCTLPAWGFLTQLRQRSVSAIAPDCFRPSQD
jgi:hypothetical protein